MPSARRGARASKAHVLGLVPRESERSGAQAHYTRKPPSAVRGRDGTWEHGLAPNERQPLARAVPFQKVWPDCPRLGAVRARVRSAHAGPRSQRERAQCRASALHAQATPRSEREAWHMGARAWRRKNGSLSLVQCPSIVHGPRVTGSARRARASDAHVLGLVYRERDRSGAQTRYTRKRPRAVRGRPARGSMGWRR